MKDIQICLWFNGEAEEAATFYASIFKNSKIEPAVPYGEAGSQSSGQPKGSTMTVEFNLEGLKFLGLNGGPHFKLTPSISLFVGCENQDEINYLWSSLSHTVRMELQSYPFAEKYGWCEDKFGLNWQLILGQRRQKIVPALLFANAKYGKAEEAINYYISNFPNSRIETITHDETNHSVLHSVITLCDQDFIVTESSYAHEFDFTPGISFMISCDTQMEIDAFYTALSAIPQAEQCGWAQDKYGISWQILYSGFSRMMRHGTEEQRGKLMGALMKTKRMNIQELENSLL